MLPFRGFPPGCNSARLRSVIVRWSTWLSGRGHGLCIVSKARISGFEQQTSSTPCLFGISAAFWVPSPSDNNVKTRGFMCWRHHIQDPTTASKKKRGKKKVLTTFCGSSTNFRDYLVWWYDSGEVQFRLGRRPEILRNQSSRIKK